MAYYSDTEPTYDIEIYETYLGVEIYIRKSDSLYISEFYDYNSKKTIDTNDYNIEVIKKMIRNTKALEYFYFIKSLDQYLETGLCEKDYNDLDKFLDSIEEKYPCIKNK